MGFLEWLTGMGLMFFGWSLPPGIGYAYVNEYNGNIFIGILIGLTAIPIEMGLYKLFKRFEETRKQKEKEYKQAQNLERRKRIESFLDREEAQRPKQIISKETYLKYIEVQKQAHVQAEKERLERIKASPVRDLSPIEFEEFTKQYLDDRNYTQVNLTRTSGDFGADVIAIAPDNVRVCIQCKKYSKPVGISAIQEIHSAKAYYNCGRAYVVTTSAGFSKPAIDLADKVQVSLFAYDDYDYDFKPINRCAHSF